jgi:hypothetical protein
MCLFWEPSLWRRWKSDSNLNPNSSSNSYPNCLPNNRGFRRIAAGVGTKLLVLLSLRLSPSDKSDGYGKFKLAQADCATFRLADRADTWQRALIMNASFLTGKTCPTAADVIGVTFWDDAAGEQGMLRWSTQMRIRYHLSRKSIMALERWSKSTRNFQRTRDIGKYRSRNADT